MHLLEFAGGLILIYHRQFGQGKDVIFLHGWGGSSLSFSGAAQIVGKYCRVTTVDFYGFGETPHPDYPLTVEDYAKGVVDIINAYRMTKVTVVGHSFGGRVALRLAAKYGYLLDGVVICDGAGLRPRRGIGYYCKIFRHKLLKKLNIPHKAGSSDYRALSGAMKQTFINVVNEDQTAELEKITLPVLLFWGDKDKDTPIYMAKRMHRRIEGSGLVVIKGAGHYAYIEAHGIFLSVLNQFLSGGGYEVDNRTRCRGAGRRDAIKISLPGAKRKLQNRNK